MWQVVSHVCLPTVLRLILYPRCQTCCNNDSRQTTVTTGILECEHIWLALWGFGTTFEILRCFRMSRFITRYTLNNTHWLFPCFPFSLALFLYIFCLSHAYEYFTYYFTYMKLSVEWECFMKLIFTYSSTCESKCLCDIYVKFLLGHIHFSVFIFYIFFLETAMWYLLRKIRNILGRDIWGLALQECSKSWWKGTNYFTSYQFVLYCS